MNLRAAEKALQILEQAVCLHRFDLAVIKPRALALRARIEHDVLVSLALCLHHRHVTGGTFERRVLVRVVRNVPELDEDVVVLELEVVEILGMNERAFTSLARAHGFENRVRGESAGDERLLAAGAVH